MKKRLKAWIVAAMVALIGFTVGAAGCDKAEESPSFDQSDEWSLFY